MDIPPSAISAAARAPADEGESTEPLPPNKLSTTTTAATRSRELTSRPSQPPHRRSKDQILKSAPERSMSTSSRTSPRQFFTCGLCDLPRAIEWKEGLDGDRCKWCVGAGPAAGEDMETEMKWCRQTGHDIARIQFIPEEDNHERPDACRCCAASPLPPSSELAGSDGHRHALHRGRHGPAGPRRRQRGTRDKQRLAHDHLKTLTQLARSKDMVGPSLTFDDLKAKIADRSSGTTPGDNNLAELIGRGKQPEPTVRRPLFTPLEVRQIEMLERSVRALKDRIDNIHSRINRKSELPDLKSFVYLRGPLIQQAQLDEVLTAYAYEITYLYNKVVKPARRAVSPAELSTAHLGLAERVSAQWSHHNALLEKAQAVTRVFVIQSVA